MAGELDSLGEERERPGGAAAAGAGVSLFVEELHRVRVQLHGDGFQERDVVGQHLWRGRARGAAWAGGMAGGCKARRGLRPGGAVRLLVSEVELPQRDQVVDVVVAAGARGRESPSAGTVRDSACGWERRSEEGGGARA